MLQILACVLIVCGSISCSKQPELKENNNPNNYTLVPDILWASPDGFDLTMDIYTPTTGKDSYPVVVMFHGGGWLINDKSIMDQSAAYLATNSNYVICNVNYRLLSDNNNSTTMNAIVDDAFGAVLWVKEHIKEYKGDPARIAVTGDSAGGHLAAMIVNSGTRISAEPFSPKSLKFTPSYLPEAQSVEELRLQNGLAVQAAILSYPYEFYQAALDGFENKTNPIWWFQGAMGRGFLGDEFNVEDDPAIYMALSALKSIPDATKRQLPPQLLTVGSNDPLVSPASVKTYMKALQAAGQPVQYWEYQGKSHAFLDSGSNWLLGTSFELNAPPALKVMIRFLDDIFYP
jgi:acetyl esterase/lipase